MKSASEFTNVIRQAVKIAFVLPLLSEGNGAGAAPGYVHSHRRHDRPTHGPYRDSAYQWQSPGYRGYAVVAGFPVWASAELYDPLTGKFALTGSMITPRAGHTSTLLGWKGPDLRRLPFQCARLASEFRRERGTV